MEATARADIPVAPDVLVLLQHRDGLRVRLLPAVLVQVPDEDRRPRKPAPTLAMLPTLRPLLLFSFKLMQALEGLGHLRIVAVDAREQRGVLLLEPLELGFAQGGSENIHVIY